MNLEHSRDQISFSVHYYIAFFYFLSNRWYISIMNAPEEQNCNCNSPLWVCSSWNPSIDVPKLMEKFNLT